jgi:DNA replication protein DnaC
VIMTTTSATIEVIECERASEEGMTPAPNRVPGRCDDCGVGVPSVTALGVTHSQRYCDACIAKRARQREVKRLEAHLTAVGLPRELWSYDRGHAGANAELLDWCVAHSDGWLWLGAYTGAGKTRALARALVIDAWRKGRPSAKWLPAATWCEALCSRDSGSRRGAVEELEAARTVDLLVFDDFGQENITDRARALLFAMLDARYIARRRTWFSTNANRDNLLASIGAGRWEQIRRRIVERGWLRTWDPIADAWTEESRLTEDGKTYWWQEL